MNGRARKSENPAFSDAFMSSAVTLLTLGFMARCSGVRVFGGVESSVLGVIVNASQSMAPLLGFLSVLRRTRQFSRVKSLRQVRFEGKGLWAELDGMRRSIKTLSPAPHRFGGGP